MQCLISFPLSNVRHRQASFPWSGVYASFTMMNSGIIAHTQMSQLASSHLPVYPSLSLPSSFCLTPYNTSYPPGETLDTIAPSSDMGKSHSKPTQLCIVFKQYPITPPCFQLLAFISNNCQLIPLSSRASSYSSSEPPILEPPPWCLARSHCAGNRAHCREMR